MAQAHGGGTDSAGGHYNRKTGVYHYHNSGAAKPSQTTQSERERLDEYFQKKLNEADYRDFWARSHPGSEVEVRCPDGTRCDITHDGYAIEVDWANKWYEGFGQALWYGFQLNMRPAVLLILRTEEDRRYVYRINSLAEHHGIDLRVMTIGPTLEKMETLEEVTPLLSASSQQPAPQVDEPVLGLDKEEEGLIAYDPKATRKEDEGESSFPFFWVFVVVAGIMIWIFRG